MKLKSIMLFAACLALCACDSQDNIEGKAVSDSSVVQTAVHSGSIHWFDGTVEAGFAQAKAENKPVFLYWGAVWCPPCQEIKHTVFKSKQFIALTKLFVPIYLDGDTERAQAWGEKFGVKGYPTMIVFNPAGEEITRIPGGIDISRYNTVLDLSLNSMRPTSMLVKLALHDSTKLQSGDFVQLAYYSWGQDFDSLPKGTPATFFRDLSDLSDDPQSSARLYMQYLIALAREKKEQESDADNTQLFTRTSTEAYARLIKILDSNELTLACWEYLAYYTEDIVALPVFAEDELAPLQDKWQQRMFALRAQSSLSTTEKLSGWLPLLSFHFLADADAPLPQPLVTQLRADVQKADADTTDSYARQSVVSQMGDVLQSAKLYDDARSLLLAELDKSASPYYFMSGLAYLEEELGNISEALNWRRKAYENAVGEATRFQWGASYVRAVIRLTPENRELVMSAAMMLFDELEGDETPFTGRNFRVLRSVKKQLQQWQLEQSDETLTMPFASKISALCQRQTEGSLELKNCRSLESVQSKI